jgi:L-cysteine S-thiosulfotransferase
MMKALSMTGYVTLTTLAWLLGSWVQQSLALAEPKTIKIGIQAQATVQTQTQTQTQTPTQTLTPTQAQTPTQGLALAIARGFTIMADQRLGNCMACHSVPDALGKKYGVQSTFAPPLDAVASRYDAPTLRQWVEDAREINPQTMMPPFAAHGILSALQINDVLASLSTLK